MNKKYISFRDIIDFIEVSVLDNSVEKNYDNLLDSCYSLGVSSYSLNVLICKAKENGGERGVNEDIDSVIFLTNAGNEINETKQQLPKIVVKYKKRKGWILLSIVLLLINVVMCVMFNSKQSDTQKKLVTTNKEKDEWYAKCLLHEKTINESQKINNILKSLDYQIGSSLINSSNYDFSYLMWISVKKPLRLNSTYVKANKEGRVKIELYDKNRRVIKYNFVEVGTSFTKISLNFRIPVIGVYALGFECDENIKLQWHKSNSIEYSSYKNEVLEITGCCSQFGEDSNSINKQQWYQYFYEINYSLL